jgi:hypothetical protein
VQARRVVIFDTDDVDAAMVELDCCQPGLEVDNT